MLLRARAGVGVVHPPQMCAGPTSGMRTTTARVGKKDGSVFLPALVGTTTTFAAYRAAPVTVSAQSNLEASACHSGDQTRSVDTAHRRCKASSVHMGLMFVNTIRTAVD